MRLLAALVALLLARADGGKDPSKEGGHTVGWRTVAVPDAGATLDAAIFYPAAAAKEGAAPEGGGPWPVCVFSPGGPAPTWRGYEDFGKRFASWGVVTLVVAFGDRPAEKRAPQFATARAWLEQQDGDAKWFLKGKLDPKNFLAGGHSRGAAAAMLAAADAKKWAGCVAVGPSLPALPSGYSTPTFLIGSKEDSSIDALYGGQKKPRWLVVVADMDHYLAPAPKREVVLSYCSAWLGWRLEKVAECKAWIAGERGKKDLKEGTLSAWKSEE